MRDGLKKQAARDHRYRSGRGRSRGACAAAHRLLLGPAFRRRRLSRHACVILASTPRAQNTSGHKDRGASGWLSPRPPATPAAACWTGSRPSLSSFALPPPMAAPVPNPPIPAVHPCVHVHPLQPRALKPPIRLRATPAVLAAAPTRPPHAWPSASQHIVAPPRGSTTPDRAVDARGGTSITNTGGLLES
jgi:hypothetical protein